MKHENHTYPHGAQSITAFMRFITRDSLFACGFWADRAGYLLFCDEIKIFLWIGGWPE
jgi:hypothetical protein